MFEQNAGHVVRGPLIDAPRGCTGLTLLSFLDDALTVRLQVDVIRGNGMGMLRVPEYPLSELPSWENKYSRLFPTFAEAETAAYDLIKAADRRGHTDSMLYAAIGMMKQECPVLPYKHSNTKVVYGARADAGDYVVSPSMIIDKRACKVAPSARVIPVTCDTVGVSDNRVQTLMRSQGQDARIAVKLVGRVLGDRFTSDAVLFEGDAVHVLVRKRFVDIIMTCVNFSGIHISSAKEEHIVAFTDFSADPDDRCCACVAAYASEAVVRVANAGRLYQYIYGDNPIYERTVNVLSNTRS